MKRTHKEEMAFGNILVLSNKLQTLGDTLLPELTLKQWFLLIVISKMDNTSPTLNEIADAMSSTRQNIKRILTSLEEKGFVKISESKMDRRALAIMLEPKTFQYFNDMEDLCEININKLFKDISEKDLSTFLCVLNKLFYSAEHFNDGESI